MEEGTQGDTLTCEWRKKGEARHGGRGAIVIYNENKYEGYNNLYRIRLS